VSETTFPGWAILELMGHRRLAGFVTEAEVAGTKLLRLDVYAPEPPDTDEDERPVATQLYGGAAIYCITPTTEEIARAVAATRRPEPVQRWELPPAATVTASAEDDEGVPW
jgi:hypothetical protein